MLVTSFTAKDPKGTWSSYASRFLPPRTAPQPLLACCQLQKKITSNPELLRFLAPKFTSPSLYLIKRRKKKMMSTES